MVWLEQAARRNLDAVLALKVNDSRTGFVSTTAKPLAQAISALRLLSRLLSATLRRPLALS